MYYPINMTTQIRPIYSPARKVVKASISTSCPYPNLKAAFNWLNVDFPYLHTHDHWEIFVILRGTLQHTINDYQENCSRGYACLIRPTDSHCLTYVKDDTDVECINFTFSSEYATAFFDLYKQEFNTLPTSSPLHFFLDNNILEIITKQALLAQSTPTETYEKLSLLIVHQLLLHLFSQKTRLGNNYPEWLNEFLHLLYNSECFQKSTKELAAMTPYSYSHLSRIFKQYLGKTLVEYLTELKMTYAKRLLQTTNKSVLDISLDIGYESVSSFNHNFKAFTGLSPLQYRKNT